MDIGYSSLGCDSQCTHRMVVMPNPHLSVVAAIASLGNIINIPGASDNANQNGLLLNVNGFLLIAAIGPGCRKSRRS